MKQVVNVSIGNKSFIVETEAYNYLSNYLNTYKAFGGSQSEQTMNDLEERIAEILSNQISQVRNVVTLQMVRDVASQIGLPDGSAYNPSGNQNANQNNQQGGGYSYQDSYTGPFNTTYAYMGPEGVQKRLYRDSDHRSIAGVCAGLGAYFNIEPLLFKIIFLILFFVIGGGLLCYIILWILLPKAVTPAEKCELRGLPKTAENLSKFSNVYEYRK